MSGQGHFSRREGQREWQRAIARLSNLPDFWEAKVTVRVPKGQDPPEHLVMTGSGGNRAYCLNSGKVFQMTNGWYEPTGRSVSPDFIQGEYEKQQIKLLNSALVWL